MTIKQVIDLADELEPNAYPHELKRAWLGELDGRVFGELLKTHEGCPMESFTGYDNAPDETELLVPFPYAQQIYGNYLKMQIALENGEINRYNAAAPIFNVVYQAYAAKYTREHKPIHKNRNRFRF